MPAGSEAAALEGLARRLFAVGQPADGQLWLLAAALVGLAGLGLAAAGPAEAAAAAAAHSRLALGDLAEGDAGFWSNVLRYVSYFFSVLLGTAYVAVRPLLDLFKRPATAILAVGALVGLLAFVKFTVSAMLGVTEPFEYTP